MRRARNANSSSSSSSWFHSSFNDDGPSVLIPSSCDNDGKMGKRSVGRRASSVHSREEVKPKKSKVTRSVIKRNSSFDEKIEEFQFRGNTQSQSTIRTENNSFDSSMMGPPVSPFSAKEAFKGEECLLDKFAPKTADQLAINPKKVQEVRDWIGERLDGSYRGYRTLLLTGPSGSGKTTTIRVLAAEFGLELVEFDSERECEMIMDYGEQRVKESSEVDSFREFLRNVEYSECGQLMQKNPKIVLIEQLPHKFYSDLRLFHETLSYFVKCSRQMIVIVQSTVESCWEISPRRMFPKDFLVVNDISEISFNKSAVSFLSKSLEKIVKGLNIRCPSSEVKRIAEESEGDIRCAVNAIRFSINSDGKWIRGVKTAASEQIDVFHMLGRLLYAKREESENKSYKEIEKRLLDESIRRPSPERNVNEVLDRGFMAPELIASFLVEHEPKFAPSMSALHSVLNSISMIDALPNRYDVRMRCDHEYISQIAARSTMFYNYKRKANGGMYKFTKPKWNGLNSDMKAIKNEVEMNYKSTDTDTSQLFTLTIPMLRILKRPLDSLTFRSVGFLSRPMNVSYQVTRDMWVQSQLNRRPLYTKKTKESALDSVGEKEVEEFEIEEDSD